MNAVARTAALPAGRVLVLGLGRTGVSCARHFARQGRALRIADSRATPPGLAELHAEQPALDVHVGPFAVSLLEDVAFVVASPGLSLAEPVLVEAARRGLPIVGDIELFAREAQAPVAAITGTNGKSTVTTLLALMANAAGRTALAGGNLGEPALDLLQAPQPQLYVLELSSYQLETTESLRPLAATVLNVSPDHLDRHADLEAYAAAKARIYAGADTAVVNLDDARVRAMPRPGQRVIGFGLGRDADWGLVEEPEPALARRGRAVLPLAAMKLQGRHNAANALAALAMSEALGLPLEPSLAALRDFSGLRHRTEWVAEVAGVRYVDDSKGTNVGATVAAVSGLPGPLVLIAGGDGKGQDFSSLRTVFAGKVRHLVLIGRDASQLAGALEGVCPIERAADMPAAVRAAAAAARPGDTVLLSPACASLDMFRDYAHRGAVFAAAARELAS